MVSAVDETVAVEPPSEEDKRLLADTGQKVLQHVDDTLAAVSDKLFELLQAANVDLSEEDIQALLSGQELPQTSTQPPESPIQEESSKSKQTPSVLPLPTVEEDHTATASTSVISTEMEINGHASSPVFYPRNQIPHQEVVWEEHDGNNNTLSSSADNVSLIHSSSDVMDNADDDNDDQSVATTITAATTATRRELKNRVGDIEGHMEAFIRQMQELNQRMKSAEERERQKRETEQQQRETVLAESQQVIQQLSTQLDQNEQQVQVWQTKAQEVEQARKRLARAQQERQALQAKTQALETKLQKLGQVLLHQQTDTASSSRAATDEDASPPSPVLRQNAWLAVALATLLVAIVLGEYTNIQQHPIQAPAVALPTTFGLEQPTTVTANAPVTVMEAEEDDDDDDDDIPTLLDMDESILEEDANVEATHTSENIESRKWDRTFETARSKNGAAPKVVKEIMTRLLRGIKNNTTKIWGKIKGIGDDIPSLVSIQ